MPLKITMKYVFPTLMSVHNMDDTVGRLDDEGAMILPKQVSCSSEELDGSGCFLLDTGLRLFLWVGRHAPKELLMELFGATFDDVGATLPSLDNPINQMLNTV